LDKQEQESGPFRKKDRSFPQLAAQPDTHCGIGERGVRNVIVYSYDAIRCEVTGSPVKPA
jgi:hypothetical protein